MDRVKTVKFYEIDEIADELLECAVIVARHGGKGIFCKNRNRKWELPGGHRERGESILETARRELWEETGATEFTLTAVCAYSITRYGALFFAEIKNFEPLPESEIEAIDFFDDLPEELSFPQFHPKHFMKVKKLYS